MSALSILAEECELLTDSKYRGYITQVERALKSFDSTSEWADLISALGKLNKVLLAHVKYPVIPKRVTIGKRLAQCLHPALPSGVHMKALETYDIIFKCIGTERLAQDLFIYTAGLFPLLSYAAMNVKPVLLLLYERHFVSLGQRIKPGLNGLLLGLLPGLEEGSESYDHTNAILEDFCECTEPSYFYTCLWECVHSCPSVRLPANTFLLSHFNKKKSMEDQLHMMGLNINLLVEAICHAVQDSSVLVQRSLLDFLLVAFPLHNSQLTYSDMGKIVRASINVLLRRDMSLNRRFYAWLLGSGTSMSQVHDAHGDHPEVDISYFEKYSRDLLVQALKWKLTERQDVYNGGTVKSVVLKPFRMLISLLDKPEIGPVILESVLLSIFRCLYTEFEFSKISSHSEVQPTERRNKSESDDKGSAYDELLKTANLLFGTFEPYFIWDYIARLFEYSCQRIEGRRDPQGSNVTRQGSLVDTQETVAITELCQLVTFLLDIVSLETYSETQTEHLPTLLCHITTSLTQHVNQLSDADIVATLSLCTNILSKVQPTLTTPGSHDLSHPVSPGVGLDVSHGVVEPGVENTQKDHNDSKPLTLEQALEVNRQLKSNKDSNQVLPTPDQHSVSTDTQDSSKETKVSTDTEQQHASGDSDNSPTKSSSESEVKRVADESTGETSLVDKSQGSHQGLSRTNSKQNKSANLMQQCIDCFQSFFHALIRQKILKDKGLADKCFESVLLNKPDGQWRASAKDQDSCLESESELSCDDRWCSQEREEMKIPLGYIEDVCLETFSSACHLMVEFASFPMYSQTSTGHQLRTEKDNYNLPVWIQDLVTCCCFVDNFHIQSSAISTMLDLIVLTQSVQVDPRSDETGSSRPRSVSILPTLHHHDLIYLAENTLFYKFAANILWNYLSEKTCQYHQQTVKLFHILHQVAPSSWVCENVIGNQLVHDSLDVRVDAFKKFTVLWHLSRNRRSGVIPGKPLRTFDRSMFVVLDSLKEESSPVKVIATTWLGHVIQHGDISRVMEPLLLMLLHPDTARVSIQHVNIHKPRKVCLSESSDDRSEANIYAISSEGGNIIYHVSQDKEIPKKQTDEMKSYALTVLGERGASLVPQRSRSEQELHFEKVDPNDLNLRINPFGSENSLDALIFGGCDMVSSYQEHIYSKAKRLDKETCAQEGITFTENGESVQGEETDDEQRTMVQSVNGSENSSNSKQSSVSNSTESILESSEDLVKCIIDELIRNVVKEDNSSSEGSEKIVRKAVAPRRLLPQRADSITSSTAGDQDLLNAFQKHGSGIDSPTLSERETSLFPDTSSMEVRDTTDIHTLHMHMLLYMQKYDVEQTMYALSTIKSMLEACPRLLVTSLVTTNISSLRAPQLAKLQLLLARHRKSVFGKNFFGEIPSDVMSNYRSNMFIEVLISVCLYFIRGYYPNLMMSKLSSNELLGNKRVHIIATEALTLMMSEILGIMRDSGINFISYISDLLQKCKVQKALLHCILAVIYNSRKRDGSDSVSKITEAIVAFNEENLDPSANETFQIKLLDLLLVMIMLEDQIGKFQSGIDASGVPNEWERLKVSYQPSLNNVRYNGGNLIVQQGMFVSGILSALKQYHLSHMHRHWIAMVTAALPFMGKYLPGIVITVVSQLCRNLEAVAAEYETGQHSSLSKLSHVPPDHIVTLLNGLMTICHYCLLDNVSPVSIGQHTPTSPAAGSVAMASSNILSNLFNVFNPVGSGKDPSPQRDTGIVSPVLDARTNILSVMPRIIACMASMWRAINLVDRLDDPATLTMGSSKVVRQNILEFVSPISLPHGTHLLGAIAVAWNDRRKRSTMKGTNKKVLPAPCEDQLLLVDLVSAIRVMPMDTLIQTVKQVLKSPPSSELSRAKRNIPLEVNMLQFFYAFVQQTSASQLLDSWPALLGLLREGLQLSLVPPGQFILLMILNEFVQKTPCMSEKKNQRDVQEIAQRLLEAVSALAGSCLEQTTWLRKNFAVKPGVQSDELEQEDGNQPEEDQSLKDRRVADPDTSSSSSMESKYSVQALSLLAELTAPLLDVIYSSEEKDKVAPFLTTLLYNIFPYLKNHSCHNLPSLRAGSQFLSSISSYQYTRKAWKKEALELLLDSSFFQMDLASIGYWFSVIDNLMTHDKTTYKDLMARVSMTQTGSLNLFSNREQEISQKAGMLKRLAFTIFCSEPDQYQKSIPEIQEKLAESLRVPQAPSIMAQVFLCFRVLMLRVSPQHLTSMWPTIITELIHVFLQIEQELSTETEEFVTQVQRIAALDSSWAHLGNGLNAHNNPSWLQLYLSACKLLDLCLSLPADRVPQFQLYRWAFIGGAVAGDGEEDEEEENVEEPDTKKKKKPVKKAKQTQFKPHIIRLARLLNARIRGDVPIMKMTPGQPLLTFSYLRSLAELQPFFNTLCLANQTDNLLLAARQLGASMSGNQSTLLTNGHPGHNQASQSQRGMQKSKSVPHNIYSTQGGAVDQTTGMQPKSSKQFIEDILKRDFLETMP